MQYTWLPRAIEWVEVWGCDRELVEAAAEHPTQISDDPKTAEVGYPVKRHRRGDLEVSVGFREPEYPTILHIHLHLPMEEGGAGTKKAGGAGSSCPKGLREFKDRVHKAGYLPKLRNGHTHILREDGSLLMVTGSTPSDYRALQNQWTKFRKLADADAVRTKLQELKAELEAEQSDG